MHGRLVPLPSGDGCAIPLAAPSRMRLGYFTNFKSRPHVVLLSGSPAEFAFLRRRIAALSSKAPILIHELSGVEPVHGTTLAMDLSRRERVTRTGPSSFEWEVTPGALEESLERIDTLTSQSDACHQYFDCDPADDAAIMMAVDEYDDAWWSRVVG